MIKIGDNVRFLNAVGGGTVRRIDGRQGIVYVEDADGFQVPVLERECVAVPKVSPTTNVPLREMFAGKNHQAQTLEENNSPTATAPPHPDNNKEIAVEETDYGDVPDFFLAFFARDLKQLSASDYHCTLLNDSNYFLYYTVNIGQKNECRTVAHGLLEPNMQEFLTEIKKETLNDWENIHIQIIAFKKEKCFAAQNVLDLHLKINPVNFYKLHSFTENDYFDQNAMLINLMQEQQRTALKQISPQAIKQAMYEKQAGERTRKFTPKPKPKAEIIEIDLHIGELLETTSGLSNADMLEYQMNKFHETLAAYKDKRGQRIVFIHGKGEGVLRSEIEKALKTRYKSCYFQDAPFQKYGFGATLVMIR